ncbi:MAG: hypothetical protein WBV23_07200 [Desulfobaccales bacterium]
MAVSPKALASWGLRSDGGGHVTRVIQEMEIVVATAEPLAVELSAAEISVELSDNQ